MTTGEILRKVLKQANGLDDANIKPLIDLIDTQSRVIILLSEHSNLMFNNGSYKMDIVSLIKNNALKSAKLVKALYNKIDYLEACDPEDIYGVRND
jgi:hypothetical protein